MASKSSPPLGILERGPSSRPCRRPRCPQSATLLPEPSGEAMTEEPIEPSIEPMEPATVVGGAYDVLRESRQQTQQPGSAPTAYLEHSRSRVLYRIVREST